MSVDLDNSQVKMGELTDIKTKQLNFWTKFRDYLKENNIPLRPQSPGVRHWITISIGSSEVYIALTLNSFDDVIGTELYISNNKNISHFFEARKNKIEMARAAREKKQLV